MALVMPQPVSRSAIPEETLVSRANALIDQGYALQDMQSLQDLEVWDEAVNELLEVINDQVLNDGMAVTRLKYRIECLLGLYGGVLASISQLQQGQKDRTGDLVRQLQSITG
jgi:hypothetical protein